METCLLLYVRSLLFLLFSFILHSFFPVFSLEYLLFSFFLFFSSFSNPKNRFFPSNSSTPSAYIFSLPHSSLPHILPASVPSKSSLLLYFILKANINIIFCSQNKYCITTKW
uniref:Uncharacterized protein n=1 Tax=Cacopsylla melanoneura TaxID=428564 RepID=A0A8D8XVV0_9HEMI